MIKLPLFTIFFCFSLQAVELIIKLANPLDPGMYQVNHLFYQQHQDFDATMEEKNYFLYSDQETKVQANPFDTLQFLTNSAVLCMKDRLIIKQDLHGKIILLNAESYKIQ